MTIQDCSVQGSYSFAELWASVKQPRLQLSNLSCLFQCEAKHLFSLNTGKMVRDSPQLVPGKKDERGGRGNARKRREGDREEKEEKQVAEAETGILNCGFCLLFYVVVRWAAPVLSDRLV